MLEMLSEIPGIRTIHQMVRFISFLTYLIISVKVMVKKQFQTLATSVCIF